MPSLIRKEKITCENCGTQTTRNNIVPHKKRCSVGARYSTQCPNFSTKSQNDLYYHISKMHSAPEPDVTFKFTLCYQEFAGFYALRRHWNTQHGMQIESGTRDVTLDHIVGRLRIRGWGKSCVLVNISWWIPNLKGRDTKYSITQLKLSTKQSWTRNWIRFSTIWNSQQNWIWLLVSFRNT